ncbi:28S ribosomal protein S18b, mitochondrial isoform X1 [Chelmon rostratus]|uniref:28S ribosomal protein S18b, mitochondrial isoform X1 n=1 Tax=Chelmon rostratus TaxID=109905 RepID=UPI001BE68558|nr:28S ribosomal protein S18b, mitochondrial isoform X1 [Chelmon rostratus]
MAASIGRNVRALSRLSPSILHPSRQFPCSLQKLPVRTWPGRPLFVPPSHFFCKAASLQDEDAAQVADTLSHYKDRPWDYLESEEYIERYGTIPVWEGYRRNHKGGIPPQKTRKTCIRGDKICGNPCPICRDPNIIIHHQNVKLLQQFISPHTGMVYDPTRTGVCMKQQKKLNEAINTAQDHANIYIIVQDLTWTLPQNVGLALSDWTNLLDSTGSWDTRCINEGHTTEIFMGLLPFQIPYVEFSGEDYSNSHDAVGSTPPPQSLPSGDTWYKWYSEIMPDENEVAKVKKTYKAYLK